MTVLDRITIVEGDLTTLDVDAIVNAANESLAPGGGVCGAIHKAAGPDLELECRGLRGCATGDAKITKSYKLKARHVIHAVGPVWKGGHLGEDDLLASAYRRSLEVAAQHHLETVAFPAISTGIFGFPPERAAPIAVRAVARALSDLPSIRMVILCCFGSQSEALHRKALADLKAEAPA